MLGFAATQEMADFSMSEWSNITSIIVTWSIFAQLLNSAIFIPANTKRHEKKQKTLTSILVPYKHTTIKTDQWEVTQLLD